MSEIREGRDEETIRFDTSTGIDRVVGSALRHHRVAAGLAIRELGRASGVSSAMISRIENGQVSPSLTTLQSLANAMTLPVISLFQYTIQTADITHVKAGGGLSAKRFAPDHVHDYSVLGTFSNNSIKFSSARVTLERSRNGTHPFYFAQGYVFIYITEGRCTYSCGGHKFEMDVGDSLSFDAQLRHGLETAETDTVTFLTVSARPA